MELERVPAGVRGCCAALRGAGYQAYLVGGCVRDLLLGRTPTDYDAATDALPEQVAALFPRTVPTGLKHGTVTVLTGDGPVEVTTFRRDGDYLDGRRPESVAFGTDLREDLARRDFTVNAMALGADGAVVDPWGGREDLAAGLIRCVGEPERRFGEDGLRLLRAVRFAAQLGFSLEVRTAAAIPACAAGAGRVSAERIRVEVEKILVSDRPRWAQALVDWGLLARWLPARRCPDLSPLEGCRAAPIPRWAVFCKLTGFPIGALPVETRLRRAVEGALAEPEPRTGADWRRLLARRGPEAAQAAAALWGGEAALEAVLPDPWRMEDLALRGRDLQTLGLQGEEIGAALARIRAHVLERPEDNRREILLALAAGAERNERE